MQSIWPYDLSVGYHYKNWGFLVPWCINSWICLSNMSLLKRTSMEDYEGKHKYEQQNYEGNRWTFLPHLFISCPTNRGFNVCISLSRLLIERLLLGLGCWLWMYKLKILQSLWMICLFCVRACGLWPYYQALCGLIIDFMKHMPLLLKQKQIKLCFLSNVMVYDYELEDLSTFLSSLHINLWICWLNELFYKINYILDIWWLH